MVESHDVVVRQEMHRHISGRFWSCLAIGFIPNLPTLNGSRSSEGGIKEGCVVSVTGDGSNRLQWQMEIVGNVLWSRW